MAFPSSNLIIGLFIRGKSIVMVSSITRLILRLSSINLLASVSHARSFTRETETTIPTDLVVGWTSLGCYIDVGRTLSDGGYQDVIGMTDEECVIYCDNLGFTYAGTGEEHSWISFLFSLWDLTTLDFSRELEFSSLAFHANRQN